MVFGKNIFVCLFVCLKTKSKRLEIHKYRRFLYWRAGFQIYHDSCMLWWFLFFHQFTNFYYCFRFHFYRLVCIS